jgi:hypothetical protein
MRLVTTIKSMKNIYIIGLLWACSTWTMADRQRKTSKQHTQWINANAIRV